MLVTAQYPTVELPWHARGYGNENGNGGGAAANKKKRKAQIKNKCEEKIMDNIPNIRLNSIKLELKLELEELKKLKK